MFSREASKKLRQEFWTSFGKSYPRKWVLYNTRIKGLFFKFHFNTRRTMVSLDIEDHNLENRIELWIKLQALKAIILSDYLPGAIFEETYYLENGKEISRIYVLKENVSIHDKATWHDTMKFLNEHMAAFEDFFQEYKEVIEN
jgi:hypothetical protein